MSVHAHPTRGSRLLVALAAAVLTAWNPGTASDRAHPSHTSNEEESWQHNDRTDRRARRGGPWSA
ncbi:hypothetical protein [Microbacterium karelineae]|uniref:hypothetical protein n=1 Tax=Microbacterium karelineae TaxID=2654283 RepID=UPI0012EA63B8|nr:hypothetical protein [Microbacterium karelineae]